MNGVEQDYPEFVEVDPSGRYGRYNEILGKGASKTVYRAFDEYEGIEVAWNQVKLSEYLQSPQHLDKVNSEIHLLKTLNHNNIIKFHTSWLDSSNRNINFVTEMFTSGTLRQYRLKHKRVNVRAVKNWCRQILRGLVYLHDHDPPVIHRDLKCDNIFVNGNLGEVKIGDLGLASVLSKSHATSCVGTPEFMAPEMYRESYNELVDIYSFGMCILEMVTFEYPYSECTHSAQIYNQVISGKKPDAFYKVNIREVRKFIEKCLVNVSFRPSARELLNDTFLQIDDEMGPTLSHSFLEPYRIESDHPCSEISSETETCGIELFDDNEVVDSEDGEIGIEGRMRENGHIFMRLRMADKQGGFRNIYFPFEPEVDTAFTVATEMITELDITDQDVTRIADMIDTEIASLLPEWSPGLDLTDQSYRPSCASTRNMNHNCRHQSASMHGRFNEIMSEANESRQGNSVSSRQSLSDKELREKMNLRLLKNKVGPDRKSSLGNLSDPLSFAAIPALYLSWR